MQASGTFVHQWLTLFRKRIKFLDGLFQSHLSCFLISKRLVRNCFAVCNTLCSHHVSFQNLKSRRTSMPTKGLNYTFQNLAGCANSKNFQSTLNYKLFSNLVSNESAVCSLPCDIGPTGFWPTQILHFADIYWVLNIMFLNKTVICLHQPVALSFLQSYWIFVGNMISVTFTSNLENITAPNSYEKTMLVFSMNVSG